MLVIEIVSLPPFLPLSHSLFLFLSIPLQIGGREDGSLTATGTSLADNSILIISETIDNDNWTPVLVSDKTDYR